MRQLKLVVLQLLKAAGLFKLSLYLNRKKLRILCYHGFSYLDEHRFMPGLFMTPTLFKQRMETLRSMGIAVATLDDAVDALKNDQLNIPTVAITFDDGFVSTFDLAIKELVAQKFPSTVYVTSYYQQKQRPVFRLMVQYLLWKSDQVEVELTQLVHGPDQPQRIESEEQRMAVGWQIIQFGEESGSEDQRTQMISTLKQRLAVNLPTEFESKFMMMASDQQLQEAPKSGVEVELHTHRHRLPEDQEGCLGEIKENRDALTSILAKEFHHFCYPSGIWSSKHLPLLRKSDLKSATTLEIGLNSAQTDPLLLKRFTDSQLKAQIEFEADMCGIIDIYAAIKSFLKFS
jgi:peptidoglycan/xylan/chitin deacetylase (PgdA/CDA1 family)